jgi:hypothetical protein
VATYLVEGGSFRAEKPREWAPERPLPLQTSIRAFDLHPDGRRLAVLRTPEEQSATKRDHVVFIQNFFDELRRLAPPKQ